MLKNIINYSIVNTPSPLYFFFFNFREDQCGVLRHETFPLAKGGCFELWDAYIVAHL